jgi:hypothetical protein
MNQRLSRLLLAMLLFAQGAFVAHACETPATPTVAFMSDEACHGTSVGIANACLAHCLQSDQAVDSHTSIFLPPVTAFCAVDAAWIELPTAFRTMPIHAADPPPSIRFCSFQI